MNVVSSGYVLDSWAVIALYKSEEPAASLVHTRLRHAVEQHIPVALSVINLGEIFAIVGRERGLNAAQTVVRQIRASSMQVVSVDESFVLDAAEFKMTYPISYADAFAVATAARLNATLLTGDPELIKLHGVISVEPL